MAKLYYYLKSTAKSLIKDFPVTLAVYVLLPAGMAYFMSSSLADSFQSEFEGPEIPIFVDDLDQTYYSTILVEQLYYEEMEAYVQVEENSSEADFTVTLSEGFENAIVQGNEIPIELDGTSTASQSDGAVLASLFEQLLTGLIELRYQEDILAASDPQLAQNLSTQLESWAAESIVTVQDVSSNDDLSSTQYFSISYLVFVAMLFFTGIIASQPALKGLNKRLAAMPISRVAYFHYEAFAGALQIIFTFSLYILAWRLLSDSFTGNGFLIALLILLQALLLGIASQCFLRLFSQKIASLVINLLFIVGFLFGGLMGPLGETTGLSIFQYGEQLSFNRIFTDPYQTLLFENSWAAIQNDVFLLSGLIVFFYLLTLAAIKFRKEELA